MLNYFIFYYIFIYLAYFTTSLFKEMSCYQTLNDLLISPSLPKPSYLNYHQLKGLVYSLESRYPNLAKVYDIGKSVEKRSLLVLKISNSINFRPLGKPMFKYVANIHGDEAIGRQLLIYFASYLLLNYDKNERVKNILDTVETHILFSMNPDGFEKAQEGNCAGISNNNTG